MQTELLTDFKISFRASLESLLEFFAITGAVIHSSVMLAGIVMARLRLWSVSDWPVFLVLASYLIVSVFVFRVFCRFTEKHGASRSVGLLEQLGTIFFLLFFAWPFFVFGLLNCFFPVWLAKWRKRFSDAVPVAA